MEESVKGIEEQVKAKGAEFRPLTPGERQALLEYARRRLPELDRQIARSRASLRRIAAGEFPTRPPRLRRAAPEPPIRAAYDSEADALSIDLVRADGWEGGEDVDGAHCHVVFAGGRPVSVELLGPRDHLDLLGVAATRYGLDGAALLAAAQAALAAPDRPVRLDVGVPAAA